MKKLLATMMIAAGTMLFAQDAPARPEGKPDNGPGGPRPPRPAMERFDHQVKDMLDKYDINKDGVLDPDEKAVAEKELDMNELRKKMMMCRTFALFNALDENKDGKISPEEKEKLPEKSREIGFGGMGGRPGFGGPGMGPGRGEGRPPRRGDGPRKGGRPHEDKPADKGNPPPPQD
ncbi:MAG: hypothetical protein IKP00_09330 [Victivallales bacterium]|nr:hypothetical protein [Victivallales bacterium]